MGSAKAARARFPYRVPLRRTDSRYYSAAERPELLEAMEFIATDSSREIHALTLPKKRKGGHDGFAGPSITRDKYPAARCLCPPFGCRCGHNAIAISSALAMISTLYNWTPEQLKQKGAPIESFILPPAIAQCRTIRMLRKAPHPHAAVLFYDFILSEGQDILAKRFNAPTSNKIDTPLKKPPIKFIDPVLFLNMNNKWIQTYEEVITKRAKQ